MGVAAVTRMGLRFSLDTSCVLNLLNTEEALDDDLIELLRRAMLGQVSLYVTTVFEGEVQDSVEGRRAEVVKRTRFLPVVAVPHEEESRRDQLAETFFKTLWPNSPGTSKMADHGRRDCLHLASHMVTGGTAFITRDIKLREKAGKRLNEAKLKVLSPHEAIEEVERARPRPADFLTSSVAVRRAAPRDRPALETLLASMRSKYPEFDGWLSRTLSDASTVVNIGVMDGSKIGGVAIWKPKDDRTAKLATFFLHEDARKGGLGQHLLFHCLRQWVEKRIERAYVTAAADNEDIIRFCLGFGFRIEGAALRRYQAGEAEIVLTKHLVYEAVTADALDAWLDQMATTAFSVVPTTNVLAPENWFVPPHTLRRSASWQPDYRAATFTDEDGCSLTRTVADLEVLFYPVRLAAPGRSAYVVPIQPQWADRMMSTSANQKQTTLFTFADKLMLRLDNAYYCAPVYADHDIIGSPILFYVSAPESALTGVARIIDRVIAEPEDLYLRFGKLGVYKLDNVKHHVAKTGQHAGCSMAMHFGWWVPFPKPITLDQAIGSALMNGHPQRVLRVGYDKFQAALKQGGIEW